MNAKSIGKILIIMLLDALVIVGSYALALLIRIDFECSEVAMAYFKSWIPLHDCSVDCDVNCIFLETDVSLHLAHGQRT